MDTSFTSIIESAANILVLLPVKPNFDTVSAGLSLYLSVMDQKSISIASLSPMMVGMNRLIGVNKISTELGNKNLTIKFKDYDATNIEKVSYDIINGEFNLTVVPKTGFSSPQKEQLDLSFNGVSADLVILVGGTSDTDFPILSSEELVGSKIAHVGNRSLSSSRDVISLARPASTISELVTNLIKENGFAIDPDIATNLVMGIEEGSSNFAGSEVTPDTFETFAYLLRSGGHRSSRTKLSPMGFPPGSIPTQPFNQPVVHQPLMPQMPQETDAMDIEGTGESEQDINPPDDWLQPKVFKGANQPTQPTSLNENMG